MKSLTLILLLVGVAGSSFAQESSTGGFGEQVSVSYVMVPFTALGPQGIPIKNLRMRDVSLLVDGRKVAIDMFEASMNAPVSWTILVDASGSMGLAGKMDAARSIVGTLLAHRKKGDDFALYSFDARGRANVLVPFTEDPTGIMRELERIEPWGKTAFFDALSEMPEYSELGRNPSRAIILLSDGIDNASQMTRTDVERKLEGVAVPIYSFALREPAEQNISAPSEELSNIDLLEELASITGGMLLVGTQPQQLSQAMYGIEQVLRAQYLIGFPPTGRGAVKYRRISLELPGRARTVQVRAGYRGTEPPTQPSRSRQKRNERKTNS
ncbi:MAG TPA: VWA domain-containing protein [Thermoanaerobaculia bacterium]